MTNDGAHWMRAKLTTDLPNSSTSLDSMASAVPTIFESVMVLGFLPCSGFQFIRPGVQPARKGYLQPFQSRNLQE